MAMLTNGLILMNISVSNQMIAQGVVIIVAVALMGLSERGERRG
jgi:predicted ABC-type sugar transport system permease subunit